MVDLAEARRLARLEEQRRGAFEVFEAWEAELADRVAASLAAVFAPVLERFGTTLVAGGAEAAALVADVAGFASPDDLASIRTAWVAEVEHTLAPMVAMMYDTGALSAMIAHRAATEARRADVALDLLDDVLDRNAYAYLEQATNRLVGIGDTAWAAARENLLDGFTVGDSVDDMAARLQESLAVAESRAVTIARTEVVSASNAGSLAGVEALGAYGPATKQWLATVDGRTRESHMDADGQIVGLDETFTVGGYDLEFPGDPSGPPEEVINCRCTVIYPDPADPIDLDDPGRGQGGEPPSLTDHELAEIAASAATTEETPDMPQRRAVRTRSGFTIPPPPERGRFAPGDEEEPPVPPVDEAPAEPVVEEEPAPAAEPEAVTIEVPEGFIIRPFEVVLAVEGRWTGDDRFLLPNAVRWDGMLPIPVDANHDETAEQTVGLIGEVFRVPGPNEGESLVVGRGFFDLGTAERPHEAAQFIVDRLDSGVLRGASMSIDDQTLGGVDPETVGPDDDEWWMMVVEDARLRCVTVCPVGAFAECGFTLDPEGVDVSHLPPAPDGPVAVTAEEARAIQEAREDEIEALLDEAGDVVVISSGAAYSLVAAAPLADRRPPLSAFADPGFTGPTAGTVEEPDEHGIRRTYGHLATFGTCHTGYEGQCITPPRSATNYAAFRTGEVLTREGERVATGRLTVGTGHASTRLSAGPAAAHYDDTGAAVADVAVGEDRFGIWYAGVIRPGATEEQIYALRASPLSGDWRRLGTSMELVAALAVNSPGFPVPRARTASGVPQALVAALGGLRRRMRSTPPEVDRAAERIAQTIGRDRESLVAALTARVHPEEGK